jgi:hypothetical protein
VGALSLGVCLVAVAAAADPPPAPTAGERADIGVLAFDVRDEAGGLIPSRLTFIGEGGAGAELFPNPAAAPDDLAVRKNVIYSLSGRGRVTVPAGDYTVYASHGLEWSIDSRRIAIAAGEVATWSARLIHELDTRGWISGDFHLHTLTHSGHGDANMEERIISLVAEGVEFAVATDHNHNTDYRPTMERLGVQSKMTSVTGNEVSTPIGHFNAFPLDPRRPPVEHRLRDGAALFTLIREETNEYGIAPVIQVNHPRWGTIDYFGRGRLDPVTATAGSEIFCDDFDSIEVLNENAAWGYEDSDVAGDLPVGASVHWVVGDWFNLLNSGHRAAAVGNSDSHHVYEIYAGYPRNFVRSTTDDPGVIDPRAVAEAVRDKRLFTTTGPFIEIEVNGEPPGATVQAGERPLYLHVRLQAASWVDCDRVKVLVNGDVADVIDVPGSRAVLRLDTVRALPVRRDGWLVVLVEGDGALAPIVHDTHRPVRPFAVTNPIWIDADGDGIWLAPRESIRAECIAAGGDGATVDRFWAGATPRERGLFVLAAAEEDVPGDAGRDAVAALVERALADPDRGVRLCAARAAEVLGDGHLRAPLERLLGDPRSDAFLGVVALRSVRALGAVGFDERMSAFLDRYGAESARRYDDDLTELLPGRFVADWMTIGYFPGRGGDANALVDHGPLHNADTGVAHPGKDGQLVSWVEASARPDGFLSLLHHDPRPERYEQAIAYAQAWLWSSSEREVRYAIGSDDGVRLLVNDETIHQDLTLHPASPLQHLGRLRLRAGWNRLLCEVENGPGNFGLYFRVLAGDVESSSRGPGDEATKGRSHEGGPASPGAFRGAPPPD